MVVVEDGGHTPPSFVIISENRSLTACVDVLFFHTSFWRQMSGGEEREKGGERREGMSGRGVKSIAA